MGRRGIPDRWLKYNPLGERIPGTHFISFKVPLKEGLVRDLEQKERFTPQVLMESVPNLGLVIDLTNTDRYYNGKDFLGQGIRYEKIFCRGHEIPSQSVVDKFFSFVDKYLEHLQSSDAENDDDKLIGVHCTHGLNRTGYLVCRYMIRRLGFTPEDAIAAFEKARGYPMEREEYLKSLRKNEDSPRNVDSSVNEKIHNIQGGSQNYEDSPDGVRTNGFPDRRQDTNGFPHRRSVPVQEQDMRTAGFVDDFQRFPANGRRDEFNFSRGGRASFSWPSRNHRADFCNNFANSSRNFRAPLHPYRREHYPEERFSRNSRVTSRRFHEQDFDGNQRMRQRRSDYHSRSSSSFFRGSVHHRNE